MIVFRASAQPPYRDAKGRFKKARDAMFDERASVITRQARRFQDYARNEAPGKGRYRHGLKTVIERRGNSLGFALEAPEPLTTFITRGTKPHVIRARRARALRFFWPKVGMTTFVPKSGGFRTHVRGGALWIGKGYVDHPGTKKNPFIGRAFRRWLPGARRDMRRVSDRFVRELDGKAKVI